MNPEVTTGLVHDKIINKIGEDVSTQTGETHVTTIIGTIDYTACHTCSQYPALIHIGIKI
jgi:hypothetical protein